MNAPRRLYVAGPFRGPDAWTIETNIREAETLALAAWRAGAAVYCPHTCTRFFQGAAPDPVWLKGHIAWLRTSEGLLLSPRWRTSSGSRAEVDVARDLGLPIWEAFAISDDPELLEVASSLVARDIPTLPEWLKGAE